MQEAHAEMLSTHLDIITGAAELKSSRLILAHMQMRTHMTSNPRATSGYTGSHCCTDIKLMSACTVKNEQVHHKVACQFLAGHEPCTQENNNNNNKNNNAFQLMTS